MSTKPASITRRRFLATSTKAASAIAAANLLLRPGRAPGAPRRLSPNEKLNIAFIGVGGQGGDDLDSVTRAEDVNVVALCDVDENRLNSAGAKFPAAKRYRDYRKLLETEKSLDAVTVGIPDHSHAPASMMAIKLGRHVYCEKPLTRTVKEARALTLAAREAKVATQMGNQGMAFEGNRLINEWLADGAIGPVREVHVWSDRPTHRGKLPFWWPQGIERPSDTPPVPADAGLGLVVGAGTVAPVSSGLCAVQMARLVGFWFRRPGRHGHPQSRAGVFSVEAANAYER